MVSKFTCYIAQMKPLNSYKLKSKWCRLETRWRRGFLSLVARVTHSRAATLGAFSRKRSRSFPVFAIMRTCRPFPAPQTVTRNTLYNSEYEPCWRRSKPQFAMENVTQSLKEIPLPCLSLSPSFLRLPKCPCHKAFTVYTSQLHHHHQQQQQFLK